LEAIEAEREGEEGGLEVERRRFLDENSGLVRLERRLVGEGGA
jgi:hypothetical protein